MKKIILIGAGGHSKVVGDIIIRRNNKIYGYLDDDPNCQTNGYSYLGKVNDYEKYQAEARYILAIGNNGTRKRIVQKMKKNVSWETFIHPSAEIGSGVSIGEGSVVMAKAVINAGARIGRHCVINTGAIIEHDNQIGDYVHISPNAVLGGTVEVGEMVHVGIGAIIKNNINICKGSMIGAGAVVVKNIEKSGIYIGVPAREKMHV